MKTLSKQLSIFCVISLVVTSGVFFPVVNAQGELREAREVREVRAAREEGVVVVKFHGSDREQRIRLSAGETVEAALQRYRQRQDVAYAEPNYIAEAFGVPNDPYYSYQWHLSQIGLEAAWDISTGSGAVVAVIDTGVAQLSDLAGTSFVQGYDFVNNDSNPTDDNGHGTHVAGTIAQSTNNSLGVAGVAYGATLMPVKVLNKSGSGTYADIADAIRYAADNGANVINMSLGGPSPAAYLQDALQYAFNKGVTIVAAAGNDGQNSISYPAAYNDYVIAVGATRFDKARAPYSNYGSGLDVVAPGGDTSVDQNGDGYGDGVLQQTFSSTPNSPGYYFYQGTSMATPHVAGVAALVISNGNAQTPADVREALQSSAEDLGSAGWDSSYGHGLINAASALAWSSSGSPTPPPSPSPPPPAEIEVFSESFEQGLGSWTQDSQNDWFRSSQRDMEGRYSAEVDGSASNASIISSAIDLQGKTAAKIAFSWYIERGLDSGEYLAFDISTDGGTTWVEKARLRGNQDPENSWRQVQTDLSGISNLKLRFRGTMSGSAEDANVDNVKVTSY